MPDYLVLFTINTGKNETMNASRERRTKFIAMLEEIGPSLPGHDTAYRFSSIHASATDLARFLLDKAQSRGHSLKVWDSIYVAEVDPKNETNSKIQQQERLPINLKTRPQRTRGYTK